MDYLAIGNDELKGARPLKEGDLIQCWNCSGKHPMEYGTSDGIKSAMLGFFNCGEKSFLCAVDGKEWRPKQ